MKLTELLKKKEHAIDLEFAPSPLADLNISPEEISKQIEEISQLVQERLAIAQGGYFVIPISQYPWDKFLRFLDKYTEITKNYLKNLKSTYKQP